MLKDPPKFVTSVEAWNYTLAKLALKDGLTDDGNPKNYAAACAIYKRVVAKYPAFAMADHVPVYEKSWNMTPSEVDQIFPVRQLFFWHDCTVEAVDAGHGMAVHISPEGIVQVRGRIVETDPDGPNAKLLGRTSLFSLSNIVSVDD